MLVARVGSSARATVNRISFYFSRLIYSSTHYRLDSAAKRGIIEHAGGLHQLSWNENKTEKRERSQV